MKTIKSLIIVLLFSNLSFAQCWTTVNTNSYSTIGLQTDGSLWGWGLYGTGLLGLGLGIENGNTTFPPTQIGIDTDWSTNYSLNSNHALALKNNGFLYAWGNNESGQSGNGTSGSQNFILSPQQIGTDTWKTVAASSSYSLGIKTDGSLWGWGRNTEGQLGTGNVAWQNIPARIGTDNNWAKVFSRSVTSYAIKTDGTLWSWGGDSQYLLGYIPNTNDYLTPHQVGLANNWVSISQGSISYTMGLQSNGTLWVWGRNNDINYTGYYGNGNSDSNNYENNPTQIGADNDWTLIYASAQNSFALKNNGTLWGWGRNNQGRLGDGTTITRYIPTQLGTDSDWIYANAGSSNGNQYYALKANHALYTWGAPNSIPTLQGNICNLSTITFESKSILAAPNPTTNYINLNSKIPFDSSTEITIYNIVGQTIKTIHESPSVTESIVVDLSSLEKGLYLLQIKNKQKLEVLKILKN